MIFALIIVFTAGTVIGAGAYRSWCIQQLRDGNTSQLHDDLHEIAGTQSHVRGYLVEHFTDTVNKTTVISDSGIHVTYTPIKNVENTNENK